MPKITFGIIVLNGEPFTRYNLRALYPFAHQIIVAEGASLKASHIATSDGHSVDGTLDILRRFKAEEDPDDKISVITAEGEGHPNGFWSGEKDEQSQAYASRATGDWLWQVDIDEFYQPEDMRFVCLYLCSYPETTCLTFNAYHFWGGFDYVLEGGTFMNRAFQGEPHGAYRRVFRWGQGYRYVTHRPPTIHDAAGRDLASLKRRNLTHMRQSASIYMYHYTNLFPTQVIPKGLYHANLGSAVGLSQRRRFEEFLAPLDGRRATRIYDHYATHNWVRRFQGQHPPAIRTMYHDLDLGLFGNLERRSTKDIEEVLRDASYNRTIRFLYWVEWFRSQYLHLAYPVHLLKVRVIKAAAAHAPSFLIAFLPKGYQLKIQRLRRPYT